MSVPRAMVLCALRSVSTPWAATGASVTKATSGRRMAGHAPKEIKQVLGQIKCPGSKGLVCHEEDLLPTLHLELEAQSWDVADVPGVLGQFYGHLTPVEQPCQTLSSIAQVHWMMWKASSPREAEQLNNEIYYYSSS